MILSRGCAVIIHGCYVREILGEISPRIVSPYIPGGNDHVSVGKRYLREGENHLRDGRHNVKEAIHSLHGGHKRPLNVLSNVAKVDVYRPGCNFHLQIAFTISSDSDGHFLRYSRRSLLYFSTSALYSSSLPCRSYIFFGCR